MKFSGFSLMELVIVVAILLTVLAIGLPAYQRNSRTRAAQAAARAFASLIRERKQRAVALGKKAGLCVGQNNFVRLYEYHPFMLESSSFPKIFDFNRAFGIPVSVSVNANGAFPLKNPCNFGESAIGLTADADPANDWRGTVIFQSGSERWFLNAAPGVLHDSHVRE